MRKIKNITLIVFLALSITTISSLNDNKNTLVFSQTGNSYELGIEYPEGSGSGCVALCGGPGTDCMIAGQFPTSCGKPNEK